MWLTVISGIGIDDMNGPVSYEGVVRDEDLPSIPTHGRGVSFSVAMVGCRRVGATRKACATERTPDESRRDADVRIVGMYPDRDYEIIYGFVYE